MRKRYGIDLDQTFLHNLTQQDTCWFPEFAKLYDLPIKINDQEERYYCRYGIPKDLRDIYFNFVMQLVVHNSIVYPGAIDVLNEIREIGDVVFITARRNSENQTYVVDGTINFLKNNNVPYDNIIFGCDNKLETCFTNGIHSMFDDSHRHLVDGPKYGIQTLMMHQPYNTDVTDKHIIRVRNWNQYRDNIIL